MADNPVITLTTDFGYQDPFAGVMKGVILKINPLARIIDLTHGISPQDRQQAAFIVGMNYAYFPDGTIHVIVVDPGVGSKRRAILACAGKHYFIGPDNGVVSYVFSKAREQPRVVQITAERFLLSLDSPTFQGRDVFAPAAGWLSKGIDISEFGKEIDNYEKIDLPLPAIAGEKIEGEVVLIDRFGNAITNVTKTDMDEIRCERVKVLLGGKEAAFRKFYGESEPGILSSLINSSGYLEFFIGGGNAAHDFNISRGDKAVIVCNG